MFDTKMTLTSNTYYIATLIIQLQASSYGLVCKQTQNRVLYPASNDLSIPNLFLKS